MTITESGPTGQVRTYCRLCEAGCGMVATVEDGRLVQVRPDKEHPITQGFACKNGLRAVEVHNDPDRVLRPQQRIEQADGNHHFVDVSWDDALAGIAARLNEIIAEHGPRAVGVYLGNPNAFNAMVVGATMTFLGALGTDRMFSAVTQDCANKYPISELVYGSLSAQPIPDLARTDFLMLIGTNPRVSKSSFMCVADPVTALKEVRDRGARVVFVDPLDVEPDVGEVVQLRPDTDAYLLAAMLHEIHATVGFRLGAFEGRVEGLDEVAAFVAPYSPEAVADIVGIPADRIRELAQALAAAPSAAIHASTGLNMGRQERARACWCRCCWCTGNLDAPGGSYFAARASRTRRASSTARPRRSRRPSGARLPPGRHAAVRSSPSWSPIPTSLCALIVVAGNPVLTIGGGDRLAEAFADLDLLVTLDLYRNATGEPADYVLPPPTSSSVKTSTRSCRACRCDRRCSGRAGSSHPRARPVRSGGSPPTSSPRWAANRRSRRRSPTRSPPCTTASSRTATSASTRPRRGRHGRVRGAGSGWLPRPARAHRSDRVRARGPRVDGSHAGTRSSPSCRPTPRPSERTASA
ncbi:MAG: molybdopterin-dependent oxidoreductase [Acidimicrobiia bacterium]